MTTDLTKIDKPFGELDRATKGELLLAAHEGEVIEVSHPLNPEKWTTISSGVGVGKHLIYRVKPRADSIDWSQVAEGWDYCMRKPWGENREPIPFLFRSDPTTSAIPQALVSAPVTQPSYVRGTCDWRDSLITRPGKE